MTPEHLVLPLTAQTALSTTDTGVGIPGTGTIPPEADAIFVTSSSSSKFVGISASCPQGKRIWGSVGANGFKLQTLKSGETINNVDTSSSAVAAIPANATFLLYKSLSTGWILSYWTNLGAVGTAIVPA